MVCGMRGKGACVAEGGGCAWQQRWPLQRTVRILLECILVLKYFRRRIETVIIFVPTSLSYSQSTSVNGPLECVITLTFSNKADANITHLIT